MTTQSAAVPRVYKFNQNWIALTTLSLSLSVLAGCKDEVVSGSADDEVGDTGDTGCLPEDNVNAPCECTTIEQSLAWQCQCYYAERPDFGTGWGDPAICEEPKHNGVDFICADDYEDAAYACGEICGDVDVAYAIDYRIDPEGSIPCTDNLASMACTAWDPDSEITYHTSSGYYGMNWAFIAGLVSDPEPLWACDDAYFDPVSGGFVVADADSGELLYELGLRDGDKIISLNEIPIGDYNDVGAAFTELWAKHLSRLRSSAEPTRSNSITCCSLRSELQVVTRAHGPKRLEYGPGALGPDRL